jgi:hypothetical protein
MSVWESPSVTFIAGLSVAFLSLRTYQHLQESYVLQVDDREAQTTDTSTEDNVPLSDLAELAANTNPAVKSAALKIIFDRLLSDNHLKYLVAGLESQDINTRRNSLIAIQALVAHDSESI